MRVLGGAKIDTSYVFSYLPICVKFCICGVTHAGLRQREERNDEKIEAINSELAIETR
jgi:hypothetical protein